MSKQAALWTARHLKPGRTKEMFFAPYPSIQALGPTQLKVRARVWAEHGVDHPLLSPHHLEPRMEICRVTHCHLTSVSALSCCGASRPGGIELIFLKTVYGIFGRTFGPSLGLYRYMSTHTHIATLPVVYEFCMCKSCNTPI
jgi:hypothetical protein